MPDVRIRGRDLRSRDEALAAISTSIERVRQGTDRQPLNERVLKADAHRKDLPGSSEENQAPSPSSPKISVVSPLPRAGGEVGFRCPWRRQQRLRNLELLLDPVGREGHQQAVAIPVDAEHG